MATSEEWAVGYARQARADLATADTLQSSALPSCVYLHALQMACEKLSKALLCETGHPPSAVQSSHAFTAKQLPRLVRDQLDIENAKPSLIRDIERYVRHLAREVELLAPPVDDGGRRPDNCEYPWEDAAGHLHVPVDHAFAVEQLLGDRHARAVWNLIRAAADRLAGA